MFVQNNSACPVRLARAHVSDALHVAAVTLRAEYRISESGLVPWEGPRTPLDTDPPKSVAEEPLWEGTSVTAAGSVLGRLQAPAVARVDLHVGIETRTLLVFGERRWLRNAGKLARGVPAPFEEVPLSWSLAFGGSYELAPGLDPVSRRPHPGGRVPHPLNPGGMGFYKDERAAEGQPLPAIEWREGGITTWSDQPRPAGLAPCPDLVGLRAPTAPPVESGDPEWHLRTVLRSLHHAPGELVFADLPPGTPIRLAGVGASPVSFEIPPSPVRVATVRGKSTEAAGFRVRSVHVSRGDGAVLVDYAHAFELPVGGAPSWIRVEPRETKLH